MLLTVQDLVEVMETIEVIKTSTLLTDAQRKIMLDELKQDIPAPVFCKKAFISPAPMNKILRPLMAPKIFVISLTAADAMVVELVPIWVFERIIFDNSNTLLKKGIKLLSSKLPFSEMRYACFT